ncbi:hypothetical protein [Exilibacterium tricleocarpae]|uniref:hypothetical protein n=1 Tax=Exilibacterium tricleocarpae TaxID=2591008 RepID=UPI0015D237AE|nr:hypothetical protein [Exilibacterium tricleocarpae]
MDIVGRYSGKLDREYLEKAAEYYSISFSEILEYTKVTGRFGMWYGVPPSSE